MEIKRCYDTLIGASVGENQLVQSGATSVTVQSGHKYYAKIDGTESLGTSTGSAITINDSAKDMVIDLSLYLPANIVDYIYSLETATAGSGIAKLREWGFLRGYQAFNSGSLESVEVTGKKVVGFNQFNKDTITDNAYVSGSTGSVQTGQSEFFCSDFIPCLPNTQYYSNADVNARIYTHVFYDADKVHISANATANGVFTTPVNACYMRVNSIKVNRTADALCINLSSDRNGEYEAYTEQSYDYGDDTLNGIFKLDANNNLYADGDVKTSDGVITRKYGLVDLGTLTYVYDTSLADYNFFRASVSGMMSGSTNIMVAGYTVVGGRTSMLSNMTIAPYQARICIRNDAYTDATTFKQAMSGQYLLFKLATPTSEQGDPFPSPQVCYPDGTEEYVTSNNVPVGHETRYEL